MANKLEQLKEVLSRVREETAKVIIGQKEAIDRALIAIFTNNHALIEGVPGVAKTLLVRTLAEGAWVRLGRISSRRTSCPQTSSAPMYSTSPGRNSPWSRNQFLPPFFWQQINRAPSKTQSALLQAMQERVR